MDKNTVLALVLIAGLGIGGYLYFRGGTANAATGGGVGGMVPERVRQKQAAGTAIATTSNQMNPDLPPEVQDVLGKAGAAYKRGTDLVDQGERIGAAVQSGDIGAALSGAGSLVSDLRGGGLLGGGTGRPAYDPRNPDPNSRSKSAPASTVGAKQTAGAIVAGKGQIVAGGRTVSNVRDTQGNVFSSAKYAGTAEFDKLRAAADAAERKANVGASHF